MIGQILQNVYKWWYFNNFVEPEGVVSNTACSFHSGVEEWGRQRGMTYLAFLFFSKALALVKENTYTHHTNKDSHLPYFQI